MRNERSKIKSRLPVRLAALLLAGALFLTQPAAAKSETVHSGQGAGLYALVRTAAAELEERAEARLAALGRTPHQSAPSKTGPLWENLGSVRYIHQGYRTCKASSAAMAVNLLRGTDESSTWSMGWDECINFSWMTFTGSDGVTYKGVYMFDEYPIKASEYYRVIDDCLERGIPVVGSVHSTKPGYSQHHWVVIVGKSGGEYWIVCPARQQTGETIAENVVPLSRMHYAMALNDYPTKHYVYMTFTPVEEQAEGEASS